MILLAFVNDTARDVILTILVGVCASLTRGIWRLHGRVTRLEAIDETRRRNGERRP